MKINFLKYSGVTILLIIILGLAVSLVLVGNEKKETKNKWDLTTTKDGLVYRINKQTGEVSLIAGTQATKVEGTENLEGQTNQISGAVNWPSLKMEDVVTLVLNLKTKWRDGTLYYDFRISNDPKLEQIKQNSPNAEFTVSLFDEDGFAVLSIPVKLSDMSIIVNTGYELNGSVVCGLNTFSSIKTWSYGWIGFNLPAQQPSTTQPGQIPDFMLRKNNPN